MTGVVGVAPEVEAQEFRDRQTGGMGEGDKTLRHVFRKTFCHLVFQYL